MAHGWCFTPALTFGCQWGTKYRFLMQEDRDQDPSSKIKQRNFFILPITLESRDQSPTPPGRNFPLLLKKRSSCTVVVAQSWLQTYKPSHGTAEGMLSICQLGWGVHYLPHAGASWSWNTVMYPQMYPNRWFRENFISIFSVLNK